MATVGSLTSKQTEQVDSMKSETGCTADKPVVRPDSEDAAAKPVVRPDSGPAAAKPVVRPDSGPAAAKPVVRPDSGPAAAKPVVRPDSGPAAAKPVVRRETGYTAAKPFVRPDMEHAAAKPVVLVVRPDNGYTAAKPVVRPDSGHTAAKPVVRPESEHTAAKPVVRPDSGHTAPKPVMRPESEHTAAKPVVRPESGPAAAKPVVRPGIGHAVIRPVFMPESGHAMIRPVVRPESGHAVIRPVVRAESGHAVIRPVVRPESGPAAAKPVVRPGIGHAVIRPVFMPESGHAMIRPVVRPDSGHAVIRPVVRAESGHAVIRPVVRPESGHVIRPLIRAGRGCVPQPVLRPDSGHPTAKPPVRIVRPDSGPTARQSVLRPDDKVCGSKTMTQSVAVRLGCCTGLSSVRCGTVLHSGTCATQAVCQPRPVTGHAGSTPGQLPCVSKNEHTSTHNYRGTRFTSLKTFNNNQTISTSVSTNACLARSSPAAPNSVVASSNAASNPQGGKQTTIKVYSPPIGQRESSFGGTLATRDITNLPTPHTISCGISKGEHTNTSTAVDSTAHSAYYVESTPSPNDCNNENDGSKFKTPFITPQTCGAGMFKTPPLCKCGRRCKRNHVQSPGANVGRSFFCCPVGKRSPGTSHNKVGCGFFQWEVPTLKRRNSSSPASFTGGPATKSVRFSPSSGLAQPNFNTPEVRKVGRFNDDARHLR